MKTMLFSYLLKVCFSSSDILMIHVTRHDAIASVPTRAPIKSCPFNKFLESSSRMMMYYSTEIKLGRGQSFKTAVNS